MSDLKWDPSFGWDQKIYYLGAKKNLFVPFHLLNSALYQNKKLIYKPQKGRLCAGSFTRNHYIGSLTYDSFDSKYEKVYRDQALFICDKSWQKITEFRASDFLKKPSRYFSNLKVGNQMFIPFRDPSRMPNGNFAVCTGGLDNCGTPGNICELKLDEFRFEIINETILEESMLIFDEIERPTFWNEFMFFSVNGGCGTKGKNGEKIQIAKINSRGLYEYYGEIDNSNSLYGPELNNDLKLLFWYKRIYQINYPEKQNLFYEKGCWRIIENKSKTHFYYQKKSNLLRYYFIFLRLFQSTIRKNFSTFYYVIKRFINSSR